MARLSKKKILDMLGEISCDTEAVFGKSRFSQALGTGDTRRAKALA